MRVRVGDRVGVTVEDGVVYAATLPDGPIVALDGTAGLIWKAAINGARMDVAERISEDVGSETADIRDEVDRFVDHLVGLGLLVADESR